MITQCTQRLCDYPYCVNPSMSNPDDPCCPYCPNGKTRYNTIITIEYTYIIIYHIKLSV